MKKNRSIVVTIAMAVASVALWRMQSLMYSGAGTSQSLAQFNILRYVIIAVAVGILLHIFKETYTLIKSKGYIPTEEEKMQVQRIYRENLKVSRVRAYTTFAVFLIVFVLYIKYKDPDVYEILAGTVTNTLHTITNIF